MLPAGLHTFLEVAFQSLIRPSFPAEESTVLLGVNGEVGTRSEESSWEGYTYPVIFHSTRPTEDLASRCIVNTAKLAVLAVCPRRTDK